VALNAAAALVVADAAPDLAVGLEQAIAAIESGKAAAVLETFVLTRKAAHAADEG
jgi:anthranilate phosphoribosyltransferase